MKNYKKLIYMGGVIPLSLISIVSCAKTSFRTDEELKSQFIPWYNKLTNQKWNLDKNNKFINYYCNSEQQAIALYSWCSGSFWNEPLHQQKEPQNVKLTLNVDKSQAKEIRGNDYKFLDSALDKAIFPKDTILYHNVEYMEIEFWEQLKDFIEQNNDGSYNYSNVVGQTITSYGFISSTLKKEVANSFNKWRPQYDSEWKQLFPNEYIKNDYALKEDVLFKIDIKKGYKGAAFLSNFDFANFGTKSQEEQVLIKRNCKFKINNVYKENKKNIFEVEIIN